MKRLIFLFTILFYIAPAVSETLVTPSFVIEITKNCMYAGIACDDVIYVGKSKKTGGSIKIRGKKIRNLCAEGTTSCKSSGYIFHNGKTSYSVFFTGELLVEQDGKILLNERGEWHDAMEKYFGIYEICKTEEVAGGITTEAAANAWIGSKVEVSKEVFSIRKIDIKNPIYSVVNTSVPHSEGNIMDSDESLFYGVADDREDSLIISVYKKVTDTKPYTKIEVIRKNVLLDLFDGRVYYFKRDSALCK